MTEAYHANSTGAASCDDEGAAAALGIAKWLCLAGLEEFVAELLSFPGRHDDQVDALTQGLAWGRQQWSRKVSVGFYRY
jgi:hypothetical protein